MQKSIRLYERFSPTRRRNLIWFGLLLIVGIMGQAQAQTKHYVKPGGSGERTGIDWANASGDVQEMINASSSGEEVWVAAGEYQRGSGQTFSLKEGVRIYGGFPNSGNPTMDNRDWKTHVTTLRGNNTNVIVNLTGSNLSSLAVLDGFSITGGYTTTGGGGGIALVNNAPTLSNLIIYGNSALSGGGVFISTSSPTLTNVLIYQNSAINYSSGGGLVSAHGASPVLKNVTIVGNTAAWGGGIYNYPGSNTQLQNCIVHGNTAPNHQTIYNTDNGKITASHSLIEGSGGSGAWNNYYGTNNGNNIDTNPFFIDAANGNFSLQACSPAINTGDNAVNTTEKDLAGNLRIFSNIIDMGAFEFQAQANLKTAITSEPALSSAVCAGSPVSVSVAATGTGTLHYQWKRENTSVGTDSPILSFSAQHADAGTYTVTVSGDCGNTTSREFTLTVNPIPKVNLSTSGSISCSNPTVTLTASELEGASYLFSNGATQVNGGNTATVTQAGSYSVTVTAGNSCTASTSVDVTGDKTAPTPGLTASTAISCTNPTVTLTATPTSGVTYVFSNGASQVGNGNTATVTQAGSYSVVVTAPNGCSASASVDVTGDKTAPTPGLTASTAISCTNPTVTLTATPASGVTYAFGNGANQVNGGNTATVTQAGTYSVVVTSPNGCTASASVDVTGDKTAPTPGLTASTAISCTNPTVTLTATPNTGVTYVFSNGASQVGNGNTATVTQAGSYSVVVTGTNSCTASASVEVTGTSVPPDAPQLTLAAGTTLPILPKTPDVFLTVSGCPTGTVQWTGPNNTSGNSRTIRVNTDNSGTLIYQATCTLETCTSSPATFTVVVENPTASGSFDGFINGADCGSFRGWAWDRSKPNTPISVDILDGSTLLTTVLADQFRQDLLDNGKGNGRHAFRFTIPNELKDGRPHSLYARVSNSDFILKDSPKALICEGATVPGGNKPPVPPTPTVLIAPLVAQVGVPFSATLVAFTDPDGDAITYSLNGLPTGLSLNSTTRVISGTPTADGTFTLIYTATDEQGATNSVSFNLTINPAATTGVTGSFEGFLDKLDCAGIRGWVWDRKQPNTPLTVEFYTVSAGNETILGSVVANIYRQDLKDAGKGNGVHAYNFTPPSSVTNGTMVQARVLGSSFVLKGSPKAYQCANARISAETPAPLQVSVLGNPIANETVQVSIRGAEGQQVRVQLLNLQGRIVGEQHIDQAGAVEQLTLRVAGEPAGLLLLRVQSGQQSVHLKIVKP